MAQGMNNLMARIRPAAMLDQTMVSNGCVAERMRSVAFNKRAGVTFLYQDADSVQVMKCGSNTTYGMLRDWAANGLATWKEQVSKISGRRCFMSTTNYFNQARSKVSQCNLRRSI